MNAFDVSFAHFSGVKKALGLTAVWSIYDVKDLYKTAGLSGKKIVYTAYDKEAVEATIDGDTFLDLYKAANNCITRSGDNHHIYIEGFTFSADRKTLTLVTGS